MEQQQADISYGSGLDQMNVGRNRDIRGTAESMIAKVFHRFRLSRPDPS